MKILVTGGCGYVGSALIPHLLANNYKIVCLDAQWFGNGFLPENENLTICKADLRDHEVLSHCLKGCTAVIHLAGMTNDNECKKHPLEANAVNFGVFENLVKLSNEAGVGRLIFPSSAAAYGNSNYPVSEDHPLLPTTDYGRFKRDCETVLKASKLKYFILRPAGVFGYAPRMRFDLSVNMMTSHAALNGEILVAGGEQSRPHVHIRDLIDVMLRLLRANIDSDVFNVVYANQTIERTARIVARTVKKWLKREISVMVSERTDDRSYLVSGDKLRQILSSMASPITNTLKPLIFPKSTDQLGSGVFGRIRIAYLNSVLLAVILMFLIETAFVVHALHQDIWSDKLHRGDQAFDYDDFIHTSQRGHQRSSLLMRINRPSRSLIYVIIMSH